MQNNPINTAIPPILPLKNAITEICGPNLRGYWPGLDRGTLVRDFSGKRNHLHQSGATYVAGPRGNVLNFDGVDDYCFQQVFATKVGTVYLSTAANTAFVIDIGQDFRPYLRAGNSDYMIMVTDSAGKVAWGYVGENGTGETLGSELITNGDFSAWTVDNPDNWTVTESGANIITQNPSGQCQLISDGTWVGIQQNNRVVIDKLYKYSINITAVSSGSIILGNQLGNMYASFSTTGVKTGYFVAAGDAHIQIKRYAACNVTFDDVSIQQVLTPPSITGCTIYSTPSGTTQSWANIETGFNPNSIASYEVRRADFQITAALTVGCWVKGAAQTNLTMIAKYEIVDSNRQWWVGSGLVSNSKLRIKFSQDGEIVNVKEYESSIIIFNNCWHLGIFTWDGTDLKIYVDGILDTNPTKVADIATSMFGGMATVRLGSATGTGNFLTGNEGHPFICNRALSASEIAAIYNDPQCRP